MQLLQDILSTSYPANLMKTSSPSHWYLNMATINRRRPRAPKAKPKEAGPDAHVGRLRHLLDAQLTLEDALETAEDDSVITTMERSLGKGNLELTKVMNDYLQRPFSGGSQSFTITDEELFVPSDLAKEQLDGAIKSLTRTFKVTDDNRLCTHSYRLLT
jgi:hypothetical protein